MSRWHALDCQNPQVVIQDGFPRCDTCRKCPDLDRIRERYPSHPSLSIPPDPHPGQLNLWWPKCVPYVSEVDDRESNPGDGSVTERSADVESQEGFPTSPVIPDNDPLSSLIKPAGRSQASEPAHSYVYSRPLREGEFRLIVLNAAGAAKDPIHVDLETHGPDIYPEYDTCSYTWGGEEDDTTPYEPVYVGRYWDVLLQTKNCYSMLQYLRPWRGVRILWVDAICINQGDLDDRAAQVSRMNEIYQRATKVVVYLGRDLAPPLPSGQYPVRKPLFELLSQQDDPAPVSSGNLNIYDILARRYFGRVWIIQELVVSRQIIVPIAGTEYWADASIHRLMAKSSRLDLFWYKSNVPWGGLLVTSGAETISLSSGFRLASASASSDPRDKFFAMHSLLNSAHEWKEMTLDYGLSYSQLITGVSAFCILQKGGSGLLFYASAGREPVGWPTWVPLHHSDFVQWSQESTQSRGGLDFVNLNKESIHFPDLSLADRPSLEKHSDYMCANSQERAPWNQSATVVQHSGALMVDIRKVAGFVEKPTLSASGSTTTLKIYQVKHLSCVLYLATHHPLHRCVKIETDRLWALEEGSSIQYVILRPMASLKAFSIVAYCDDIYFARVPGTFSGFRYCLNCAETTLWTYVLTCRNEFYRVRASCSRPAKVAEVVYGLRFQNIDAALRVSKCLLDLANSQEHGPDRDRDLILSYQAYLLVELEGILSEPVRFRSRLDNLRSDHIEILVDFKDLPSLSRCSDYSPECDAYLGAPPDYSSLPGAIKRPGFSREEPWQRRGEADDTVESLVEVYRELYMIHERPGMELPNLPKGTIDLQDPATLSKSIRMFAPLRALCRPWIQNSPTYAILRNLHFIARKVGKTELELLAFEPEDDPGLYQKLNRTRIWPDEIVEAFKIDGRTQRINIV